MICLKTALAVRTLLPSGAFGGKIFDGPFLRGVDLGRCLSKAYREKRMLLVGAAGSDASATDGRIGTIVVARGVATRGARG